MSYKLKAQISKKRSSNLKVSLAFLLSAFSFQLLALLSSSAWAESEAPKLTLAVQKVVYEAQQLMEKKDYLKAQGCLKKFIEKNSKSPHYLVEFTLANALAVADKNTEALQHYRAAASLYPDFVAAWQNMGKIYFDLNQYNKAGDCLLKAYELSEKNDPSMLYYAAVSYIMAEKGASALPHLEYLSSGEAGEPKTEWIEALLKVCMDLQLSEKAFDVINTLLDRDGDNPRWWKILAQFHLQQNDYMDAVAALTVHSYIASANLNLQDLMLLGDLNSVIGVPQKAAEYYERALGMEQSPSNHEKLVSAYIVANKPEKAIEILEAALEQKPTSGLWFMMGQVHYEKENFDRAYNAFGYSVKHDPKMGQAYLMMGYCALQADKKDAAVSAFQKACSFPRQEKTARELLRQRK